MYRKQILRVIGLLCFTLTLSMIVHAAEPAKKTSLSATKSVNGEVIKAFENKISILESDLKAEKDISKRFDLFLKSYSELSELRAKNPRQQEEDEINMSIFMDALRYLPEKKSFDPKKCSEYKKKIRSMSQSYQGENEPFAEKAFKIVDLICA